MRELVQKVMLLGLKLAKALEFLPPLAVRLVIGYSFYVAGSPKVQNPHGLGGGIDFIKMFGEWGIPAPELNEWVVGHLECYGGILLMLGLFTRPIAALLGGSMLVAVFTAHREEFFKSLASHDDVTSIAPIWMGLFMLYLLVYGPGAASCDRVIAWALKLNPSPNDEPVLIPSPQEAAKQSWLNARSAALIAVALITVCALECARETNNVARIDFIEKELAAIPTRIPEINQELEEIPQRIAKMTDVLKDEKDEDVRAKLKTKIEFNKNKEPELKAELERLQKEPSTLPSELERLRNSVYIFVHPPPPAKPT